jgi:hypothetical protein
VRHINLKSRNNSAYTGPQLLVSTTEEYQNYQDCIKHIHRVDNMRMTGELDRPSNEQEQKELLRVYFQAQAFVTAFTRRYCMDEHGNFLDFARVAYPPTPSGVTQPGDSGLAEEMLHADEPTTVKEQTGTDETPVEEPAVSIEADEAAIGSSVFQPEVDERLVVGDDHDVTQFPSFAIPMRLKPSSSSGD